MKHKWLLSFFLFLLVFAGNAQKINPDYDSTFSKSINSDDYGMKMYVMVILKTGTSKLEDKTKINELFAGHMENIGRLAKEGKLIVAGPFEKNEKNYRGIFILNVATFEEANQLLSTDPAVKEKLLEAELYNWYGSASLPEYLKVEKKAGKFRF